MEVCSTEFLFSLFLSEIFCKLIKTNLLQAVYFLSITIADKSNYAYVHKCVSIQGRVNSLNAGFDFVIKLIHDLFLENNKKNKFFFNLKNQSEIKRALVSLFYFVYTYLYVFIT